jgi:hypothetical protein
MTATIHPEVIPGDPRRAAVPVAALLGRDAPARSEGRLQPSATGAYTPAAMGAYRLVSVMSAAVALGGAALSLAVPAHAQGWAGLQAMPKVALEISMAQELPGLGIDTVEIRLEQAFRETRPAPAMERTSVDRLQLSVSVWPVSSSELRGYYLPFSGQYAIGGVRLAVIRPARIGARPVPVPAVVWQAERQVRGPWRTSGQEVLALIDELLGEFLEDYSKVGSP